MRDYEGLEVTGAELFQAGAAQVAHRGLHLSAAHAALTRRAPLGKDVAG